MKKKRFFREDETYNNVGSAVYEEVASAIGPIIAKYATQRYNMRELQQLIVDYTDQECLFARVHAVFDLDFTEEDE